MRNCLFRELLVRMLVSKLGRFLVSEGPGASQQTSQETHSNPCKTSQQAPGGRRVEGGERRGGGVGAA